MSGRLARLAAAALRRRGARPERVAGPAAPLALVIDDYADVDLARLPDGPVFVGGTGRSGTWVLGGMLGAHPRWVTVHTELRFHADPPGFAGVLRGDVTPEKFARLVEERWYRLAGASGKAKGLQLLLSRHELRPHLREFVKRAGTDVAGALGQLMLDTVGRYVRGRGAVGFTETTPGNVEAAGALTTALPTCRVVQTVRDGRDVVASVVTMPWGPDSAHEALEWWGERMRAAHRGMTAADPARVHTVRLEELIHVDRDATFDRLVGYLGFRDREPLRRYFDASMNSDAAHVGRWRKELPGSEQAAFDRRYRRLLDELDAEGVSLPVHPDVADEVSRA